MLPPRTQPARSVISTTACSGTLIVTCSPAAIRTTSRRSPAQTVGARCCKSGTWNWAPSQPADCELLTLPLGKKGHLRYRLDRDFKPIHSFNQLRIVSRRSGAETWEFVPSLATANLIWQALKRHQYPNAKCWPLARPGG